MISVYDNTFILVYSIAVAFLLGAAIGSFLNCAAYRICEGQSFIKGRSHCTSCGHELSFFDLIPVFSFIFLRGRCRYCKSKLSPRYLITELIFAALTVGCLLRFDLTLLCLRNYIFLCCLFCLTLTDLKSYIIPNGCIIISAAAWLLYLPFSGMGWKDILFSVIASVVYGGGILLISLLLDKLLKKESMGGGDIKLFAVVGLYFGLVGTLFAVIIACVLGLIFAAVIKKKSKEGKKPFPFGPAIAVSSVIMMFVGQSITNWYLGLF